MRKFHVILFCLLMILVNAGAMQARQVSLPSNIAPELSERLRIDEGDLRREMTQLFKESGWVVPWLMISTPWFLVMGMVLLIKERQDNADK